MAVVKLFDNIIPVKRHSCSVDGSKPVLIDPYVNLYIRSNDICQADCAFCIYHNNDFTKFSYKNLIATLEEIKRNGLPINKVNITGGEPSARMEELKEIYSIIKEHSPSTYITLNTNGYNFEQLNGFDFDCISLSRHHYEDEKNVEVFRTHKIPTIDEILAFKSIEKIHIRCNLIKGYIDSREEIEKFIDYHCNLGLNDLAFVDLMNLNDYCAEHYVNYKSLKLEDSEKSLVRFSQERKGECHCKNFLYRTDNGNIAKLYSRFNYNVESGENTLVFDLNKLRIGFGGKIIFQGEENESRSVSG